MPHEVFVPPQGPPDTLPDAAIYARMGEEGIRRMLAHFYQRLARSEIAEMFPTAPQALHEASQRSADFFISVMGGPDLFRERHGEPVMRRRHMRFAIGPRERDVWLGCFFEVLEQAPERYGFPVEFLSGFKNYLESFSAWMVNRSS